MTNLKKTINVLRISYIFHIISYIIIVITNIKYTNNNKWLDEFAQLFFYIFILVFTMICFLPFLFIIILFSKQTYDIFFSFYRISFSILILSIISGVCIGITYYFNYKTFPSYFMYCPFNFNLIDIKKLFLSDNPDQKINDISLNDKCLNKKCIYQNSFYENDQKKYTYLCNFNSNYQDSIICKEINQSSITSYIIKSYLKICEKKTDFYICYLNKIPTKFEINLKTKCPTENKKKFTIEIILTIINIIIPIIILIFQYNVYRKILKLIVNDDINQINNDVTKDNSKKSKKESYEKEPTSYIIVDKKDKNEEILKIIKTQNKKNFIQKITKDSSLRLDSLTPKNIWNKKNDNYFLNNSFTNSKCNNLNKNIIFVNINRMQTQSFYNGLNENSERMEKSEIKFINIKK